MTIKPLYRYYRENGKTTVTPSRRAETDVPALYRLIADDGLELIKDGVRTPCVDVEDTTGWEEVPAINIDCDEGVF